MSRVRQIHITKASELLGKKLAEQYAERGEKADLARTLGVRQELVSRWAKGERKPTPPMRAQIQKLFPDIDWQDWDAEPGGAPPVPAFPDASAANGTAGRVA